MTENMNTFLVLLMFSLVLSTTAFQPLDDNILDGLIFQNDTAAINLASTDYGHIVKINPEAVLSPTSLNDIETLIKLVNDNNSSGVSGSKTVAARGQGHSVRGQSMAEKGIVVNMTSLASLGGRIVVVSNSPFGPYADVGGEQTWIDVLGETLTHGLSPVSWTDYLDLSVGGTLSNAGISGQAFRVGPQIANVYELDVITGKGDLVTCSRTKEAGLFYSVLGGLGQFGIITRARIALAPAPNKVKWLRLLYTDFDVFSRDQERLISSNGRTREKGGVDYVEGFLLMKQGPLDFSFYAAPDQLRITTLVTQSGVVYVIELAKYYVDTATVDKDLEVLLKGLGFVPGFAFSKDVTYLEFLNRVGAEEAKLRKLGLWDVPHPWLNLFVPKSRISDINSGVFMKILLQNKVPAGLIIVYPLNRNKWDDKMSAMTPNEEVFYTIGLLHSSKVDEWEAFDNVNKQILEFCRVARIPIKQYLPHYETQPDWINHFGSKWPNFQRSKLTFDPNKILAPGQKIFTA
ncbi:cytokinin dehydrogenase 4-like isoform X2 [Humulus lupulus]|uniref:cytokinin dehydrogenase 4-like isoform X2 n=1 Tax=Humulus lupulus TaxID=3486 RepID=UPI002B40CD15|nr:cytokinin dehydrogenase 4-like isoform X2 [Humulus lupulus]